MNQLHRDLANLYLVHLFLFCLMFFNTVSRILINKRLTIYIYDKCHVAVRYVSAKRNVETKHFRCKQLTQVTHFLIVFYATLCNRLSRTLDRVSVPDNVRDVNVNNSQGSEWFHFCLLRKEHRGVDHLKVHCPTELT